MESWDWSNFGVRKNGDRWEFFPSSTKPEVEDKMDDLETTEETEKTSASQTEKKRKKKKKNNAKKAAKHIKWGEANYIYFSRDIGYNCIPSKGEYPLGLGEELETEIIKIQDLFPIETDKLPPAPPLTSPKQDNSHHPTTVHEKKHKKNGKSKNSKKVINRPERTDSIDSTETINDAHLQFNSNHTNSSCSALDEKERIEIFERNGLTGKREEIGAELDINTVNKEIKIIRSDRDKHGCSCKHVKVDKLSRVKMKSELMNNGDFIGFAGSEEDIDQMSKTELTAKVKEVLKHCKMCEDNNCECVQMGVSCSNLLCSCLRSGYQPGKKQSCGNPEGQDLYDLQKVQETRTTIIKNLNELIKAESKVN